MNIFHKKTFKWIVPLGVMLGFLFWLTPVQAKVYKWKDDQGKTYFTDDKSKIPRKYRSKQHLDKKKPRKYPPAVSPPSPPPVKQTIEETPVTEDGEESMGAGTAVEGEENTEGVEGEDLEKTAEAEGETDEKPAQEDTGQPAIPTASGASSSPLYKEVKDFLETDNYKLEKVLKAVPEPTARTGKYLMVPVMKGVLRKIEMVKKIIDSGLADLMPIASYLEKSAKQDSFVEVGGDDYMNDLFSLYGRVQQEIETKKGFITTLEAKTGGS